MKRWFWSKEDRVYVDESGDELDDSELREGIDQYIESIQSDFAAKAALFAAGAITLTALFTFLQNEISAMHHAAGALAYGGLSQMDAEKWMRVNDRLQTELEFLNKFQVEAPELSTDAIIARANLYPEAAYSEWANQTVQREADLGVTLGRRICEEDDVSCEACISAASDEFVPLDEIPEIGSLTCMHNCRCRLDFLTNGVFNVGSDALASEAVQ